ncbi:alpha-L-fucosidase [Mariniblastus sp.]|nr:alpha-L-fucosidase [Mariniblastus sp.]
MKTFHPTTQTCRFIPALAALLLIFAGTSVSVAQTPAAMPKVDSDAAPSVQEAETAPHQGETKAERDARLEWWREGKFGMFVHWGIYSTTGGLYNGKKLPNSAEWMMARGKIPIAEYEKYADQFNPTEFDADEFVGLAKEAGMTYLVITAKHHDGFAMFDSKANPYNVVQATPFKRDIMKELADACAKQDIKFGFYYSQAQDWHHPGGFGNGWDKTIKKVPSDVYVMEKAVPEVKQLLTDYGDIGIFWWDTPRKMTKESFDALHSLTKLQANVITNDRLGEEYPGDYKTFERKIPQRGPVGKDWEVCMPISGSWGYKIGDDSFKSPETLIRNLIDISHKGGNYLLNVSPTGKGTLLPQATERLKIIGKWMKVNGESIYGTTGSPFETLEWGRCTKKVVNGQTTLYLHVFDWPADGALLVPGLKNKVESAMLLDGDKSLEFKSSDEGVTISLPAEAPDKYASVIVLKVDGELDVVANLPSIDADGKLVLTADKAFIHNNEGSKDAAIKMHDDIPHIGTWTDKEAFAEWTFRTKTPGEYEVKIVCSIEAEKSNLEFGIAGGEVTTAEVESTGGYGKYKEQTLGTLEIKKAGDVTLRLKPAAKGWQPINLRQVELIRK